MSKPFQMILVGNKCDKFQERKILYDQGKELADKFGILFLETSAKNGFNVEETFNLLLYSIIKNKKTS